MNVSGRLCAHASVILTPALVAQGLLARRKIEKLPEASGEQHGRVGDSSRLIEILLLGESTVAGVGAASHKEALAGQTAQALHSATGASVAWQVHGANGLTARALHASLTELPQATRADLIVIALGANDAFRLNGPRGWRRDLAALITTLQQRFANTPVLLSSAPPIGEFPALPQPLRGVLGLRASLLDHASERLAQRMAGVHFVPVSFGLAAAPEFFASDGIHPSTLTYTLWGERLANFAVDHLPPRR